MRTSIERSGRRTVGRPLVQVVRIRKVTGERRASTAMAAGAVGAGIGAGLAWLFDPATGRRRRHMAADKAVHYAHQGADFSGKAQRDLRNRGVGAVARTRRLIRGGPLRGERLAQRVRTELNRVCTHPRALDVEVRDDVVTLRGPIPRQEVDRVRRAVAAIGGVGQIDDQLEVHEQPGDIPSLQGEGKLRQAPRPELLQEHWTPGIRLLAGAAGGSLVSYGVARRGVVGTASAVSGGLLLARAAANLRVARLTGVGAGRGGVEVTKTLEIDAPVQAVWELWDRYEDFPRFMRNVREVRRTGDGRSHWKVEGPLGATVSWDAETTRREPPRLLSWKSLPGASVQHAGTVRLEPAEQGRTRVQVTLSYNPVAGAAGHAVASLFGSDPKQQLDDDLLRMKSLVETGKLPHDATRNR